MFRNLMTSGRVMRPALCASLTVAALVGSQSVAGAAQVRGSAASSSCGTVPYAAPDDPGHLLSKLRLPVSVKADYEGWESPILRSAWSHWKPKGKPPYKVAVVTDITNSTNAAIDTDIVNYLKHSSLVGKIIHLTLPSATDVPGQLQQYNAAVQQKPSLIILEPLAPTAAAAAVEAAGKAGIPTVSVFNNVNTPYAISIAANPYLSGSLTAVQLVSALGGKGSVLQVLGSPQALTTSQEQQAWEGVFSRCPGISLAGQTYGFYSTALAKTETLQYLTTHTAPIDGAIESGAMALGVLQAFQQAGRPAPVIGQIGALQGLAVYYKQNKSSYKWAATVSGAGTLADETVSVATRLLAGQGPKINFFPWTFIPYSGKQILPLVSSSWSVGSDKAIDLPTSDWWTSADYDYFFNNTTLTKGTSF